MTDVTPICCATNPCFAVHVHPSLPTSILHSSDKAARRCSLEVGNAYVRLSCPVFLLLQYAYAYVSVLCVRSCAERLRWEAQLFSDQCTAEMEHGCDQQSQPCAPSADFSAPPRRCATRQFRETAARAPPKTYGMPSLVCRFATSVVAGAKKWVRVAAAHVAVVLGGAMPIGVELEQRICAPNLPLASPFVWGLLGARMQAKAIARRVSRRRRRFRAGCHGTKVRLIQFYRKDIKKVEKTL